MTAQQHLARRSFLVGATALSTAGLSACATSGRSAPSAEAGYASVDDWIAGEAISFSSDVDFNAAVDRLMAHLGDQVSILGFGEPLHSGEEFLIVRNRLLRRLVEAHGYRAIAIETNDMRAQLLDSYIHGHGPSTYEEIQDRGFTLEIGHWDRNRELIEWLQHYNADPTHAVKLNLYGTLASDQETTKSPREAIEFALNYLAPLDAEAAARHRGIVEPLLGADADWEASALAISMEIIQHKFAGGPTPTPTGREIGVSPRAQALRLAVDNLAGELRTRRPELVARGDRDLFERALRHLTVARNLLDLHAALARRASIDELVSMRDAMAAEQLVYIADREQARGKVMMFLHSAHLRRSHTVLSFYEFWPTGAHLDQLFGARFAVVAGALGASVENLIGEPEAGSLEARLLAQGSDCFLPTWRGQRLPEGALATLPVRAGSARPDIPYTPLTPPGIVDADAIVFLQNVTRTRGASPLPG